MSDRIGGNRPPKAPDPPRTQTDETTEAKKTGTPGQVGGTAEEQPELPVDQFERTVKAGAQTLAKNIVGLAAKSGIKDRFTNADLAYLASTFAAILMKNPGADRAQRARLFARAILDRKKKWARKMTDKELEDMCENIGDVLDTTPVFGQLVDNVTDGANKMNQK